MEIPGFYYDKEKKKYFKIQKSNVGDRTLTKETIKHKENEKKRKKHISEMENRHRKVSKPRDTGGHPKAAASKSARHVQTRKLRASHNIHSLLYQKEVGCLSCYRLQNEINYYHISHIKHVSKEKLVFQENLEHMQKMIPNADGTKFLCLWSVKNMLKQIIQCCELILDFNKRIFEMNPKSDALNQSLSKVSSLCWAPHANTASNYILYSTMSVFGNSPSMVILKDLKMQGAEANGINPFRYREFNLGSKALWTSAWNPSTAQFSLGSEKCSLVVDVHTRRMWEFETNKSDVFAQQFFPEGGQTLVSGTRNGCVLLHDLRSQSVRPSMVLRHPSCICHLHVAHDTNYIFANDLTGKIQQWDLRVRRPVLQFKGNVNEYSRIPFAVNEEHGVLYAAGQDCYSRIWDLRTARLLCTIPPPHPASTDNIPTLCYSRTMGSGRFPALLMGILDEVHLYTACETLSDLPS